MSGKEAIVDEANVVAKKAMENNVLPGHNVDGTALLDTTGIIPGLAPDLI